MNEKYLPYPILTDEEIKSRDEWLKNNYPNFDELSPDKMFQAFCHWCGAHVKIMENMEK